MAKSLLPEELVGEFFGVGSIGETDPSAAAGNIKKLKLPYSYQLTSIHEEDMIRQFSYMIEGFEEKGDFVIDVDLYTFRELSEDEGPLIPDMTHFHGLHQMIDGTEYKFFKTQQTAPLTMCFSTRGSDGKQHLTQSMFHLYSVLMKRIAQGQVEHLSRSCKTVIICQDDPALGLVVKMLQQDKLPDLSLSHIMQVTESIYPKDTIPAYHYCDDWRDLDVEGRHILWDGLPKLAHIDVVSYSPAIDDNQAEKLNSFIERGGGLALGILPNVDDSYSQSVSDTLVKQLPKVLQILINSGVDLSLIERNTMISTQCGLSRASIGLTRKVHEESKNFKGIFKETIKKLK